MATSYLSFGRYFIVCDDPYRRGCSTETEPRFGQDRVINIAEENGWQLSPSGKFACPNCLELHSLVIKKKVKNGSLSQEQKYIYDDPFDAIFLAMIFDGDPLTAGLVSMATGNTSLGILAGMLAGDNNDQQQIEQFSGGDAGGGGAGGSWQETPLTEAAPVSDMLPEPPVIVGPNEEQGTVGNPPNSQEDSIYENGPGNTDTSDSTSY